MNDMDKVDLSGFDLRALLTAVAMLDKGSHTLAHNHYTEGREAVINEIKRRDVDLLINELVEIYTELLDA